LQRVIPILSGAAFTAAIATAAGLLLIRRLRLSLDRTEEVLFAFVSGSAILSFLVFFLCLIHQAKLGVFLGGGAVLLVAAFFTKSAKLAPKTPFSTQKWLYLTVICPLLVVYLANSVAPEVSPDGSGYHLGNVTRYWQNHGFVWDYHSIYSYLSQGIEMLYLVAFSIGGLPAAATFHLTFLCGLALLIACYGRRFGFPRAGMFAAVLVFASPIVGLVGVSAYNDVAVATCSFAVFYAIQVHNQEYSPNLLIISGLIAGFCYAVKYPGGIVLPLAVVLLRGKGIARFAPAAALMALPWMIRNWFWLGNPFAPFLNRWFPNSFYSAEAEAAYLHGLRAVERFHPLDLTLYGAELPGFLGPVFLLSPFALLALRSPQGRRLLLAAVVLAIPAVLNPVPRFLMSSLPFLALAMGLAMQNSPGVLPALAAFHVLLGLPAVMPMYCADWAWRIREMPVRVALGLQPEEVYLNRYLPDYWLKKALEKYVPKQEKIFSLSGLPEAYIDRRIVVSYESAEGLRGGDGFRFQVLNEDFKSERATLLEKRNGKGLYRID
jgi:hypothetical protein